MKANSGPRTGRRWVKPQGGVSLISVVIFSIILSVITTAYLLTVVAQQRQALRFDQSTRAYYAAESGVQDLIRALNDPRNAELRTKGQDTCKPLHGDRSDGLLGGTDFNIAYSCQLADTRPNKLRVGVGELNNATIKLTPDGPTGGNFRLVIDWSQKKPIAYAAAETFCPRNSQAAANTNDKLLTDYQSWINPNGLAAGQSCRVHPMLRLSLISHPVSGSFTRNDVKQQVIFLNPLFFAALNGPQKSAASIPDGTLVNGQTNNSQPNQEELITNASCYTNLSTSPSYEGYSCRAVIALNNYDFSRFTSYLRSTSVYGDNVQFQISLYDSTGKRLNFKDTQALLDVTGRSGNVFRRVQQTVNIGGAVWYDNIPEAAVAAGDGLCKAFEVSQLAEDFSTTACNP